MILVKYIAKSGLLSRRKSEEAIKYKFIKINGKTIEDPTYIVQNGDDIRFKKIKIVIQQFVYILLNKPNGYITSKSDPEGRPTIFNILPTKLRNLVDAVGRLDYNSSGALLLSNDGDFVYKLSHPKFEVKKTYSVVTSKPVDKKIVDSIIHGIKLEEDGVVYPDIIKWKPETPNHLILTLHSGKYRVIRRLLRVFGVFVDVLHRSSFSGISVSRLKPGEWRFLTDIEIDILSNKIK